jgi:hypothetical protein
LLRQQALPKQLPFFHLFPIFSTLFPQPDFMRFTNFLRFASAVALLGSMSSFSGCEKDNVGPKGGCTKKTTTTTPTTTTTGTGTGTGAN